MSSEAEDAKKYGFMRLLEKRHKRARKIQNHGVMGEGRFMCPSSRISSLFVRNREGAGGGGERGERGGRGGEKCRSPQLVCMYKSDDIGLGLRFRRF